MSVLPESPALDARDPRAAAVTGAATADARTDESQAARYWLCQVGGWGLYGLASAIGAIVIDAIPWRTAAIEEGALALLGVGMSHGLRTYIRRHDWWLLGLRARILRAFGASALLGIATGALHLGLGLAPWRVELPMGGLPTLSPLLRALAIAANWATVYLLWSTLYLAVLSVRARRRAEVRTRELARALQAAELRFLKSQLNPHFLFNALNAVRALIAEEPARAQSAVTQLARILRYALSAGQHDLVSFDQELAITEDYLGLEALRLDERLVVERAIGPDVGELPVPVMLLQLLVENAVKHGIAELPGGGTLRIRAVCEDGALVLEVENPRPVVARAATHESVGFENARTRLALLFGADATLTLDLSDPGRALARATLPLPP